MKSLRCLNFLTSLALRHLTYKAIKLMSPAITVLCIISILTKPAQTLLCKTGSPKGPQRERCCWASLPIHCHQGQTGVGAVANSLVSPGPYTQQIGGWSYYEICSFLKGASVQWIDEQRVPYAIKGNEWVGYDDMQSCSAKVSYLKDRQFGGVFVWTLDMDDFSGMFCNQGRYPLITHLRTILTTSFSLFGWTPLTRPLEMTLAASVSSFTVSFNSSSTQPTSDTLAYTKTMTTIKEVIICPKNTIVQTPEIAFVNINQMGFTSGQKTQSHFTNTNTVKPIF